MPIRLTTKKGRRPGWMVKAFMLGLFGLSFVAPSGAALEPQVGVSDAMLQQVSDEHGERAARRLAAWNALLRDSRQLPEDRKLGVVNAFFNQLSFTSDQQQWGAVDYWATPTEFLTYNGGDCEDFALAKYFTLAAVGVPVDKLRLTYVRAVELDQAHMVVTYYDRPDAEPLVLDNLSPEILPASARSDLIPVYSFNGEGLWLAKQRGLGQRVSGAERIGRWRDLIQRMDGGVPD